MGQRRRVRLPPGFRRGPAHPVGGRPGHLPPGDAAFPGRQRHFLLPDVQRPARDRTGSCRRRLSQLHHRLQPHHRQGAGRCPGHAERARCGRDCPRRCRAVRRGGRHAEALRPRRVRVGHLDYTYGLNGQRLPASAPWIVKLIDPAQILADAKAVRAAGAQFVLVSMHWGEEYQAAPTAQQRSIAQQLLASPDIDLVVGNHVHVVQPVERIGPKYVVYGDGNFLARHAPCCDTPQTRDGMIVQVTVEVQKGTPAVSRLGYTPTYVDPATVTILPVARTLWDPHLSPALRSDLEQSWQRTTATVDKLAAAAAGVVPTEQP